jgi:fibro-slime domain-containing protein
LGPTKCVTTTCGNKIQEGTEQCDDGNAATGDGCSPFCRLEPICPINGGACTTPCGDGILLDVDKASGQECDDGNLVNGDGCSSNCKVEAGFTCSDVSASAGHVLMPPIVIRDFKGWNEIGGHPDFEHYIGAGAPGTVQSMLSATGVPTHVPECMPQTSNGCAPLAGANPVWDPTVDWFGMWYVDNATYSKTVVQTLSLLGQLGGVNSTTCGTVGNPGCTSYQFSTGAFFPIDDQGWGNGPNTHNYGFTSLVRHWFVYAGAATFSFKGDDDVWIFINKTLAVDLGGTHGSATGVITLDPSDGSGYVCDFVAPGPPSPTSVCDSAARTGGGHVVNLGLQRGALYEVAVFHAERHTSASAYALTLAAAGTSRSSCSRK